MPTTWMDSVLRRTRSTVLTPATVGLGDFVRAAAAGWDGTDPVRTLLDGSSE